MVTRTISSFSLPLLVLALAGCLAEASSMEGLTKAEAAEQVDTGKADWSFDICEHNGWYGDGDCNWFCPEADSDCDVSPLGPEPSGDTTRYPIVLAHGFMVGPGLVPMYHVEDALRADGHEAFEGSVPPFGGVEERAEVLAAQIEDILAETGAERVNIIAHSMGGLDSRYAISTLGLGDRVASLTTISTPHQGSNIADVALNIVRGDTADAVDAFAGLIDRTARGSLAGEADMEAALTSLAEVNADAFNDANPDDPAVFYQSWAGVSNVHGIANPLDDGACEGVWLRNGTTRDVMDPLMVPVAAFVSHGEFIPNDGMVTVESAKWGVFQGCIPADHGDQVGLLAVDFPDVFTGFHHTRFYRNVVFDLARAGF